MVRWRPKRRRSICVGCEFEKKVRFLRFRIVDKMLGLTGVFGEGRGKCGIIELCSDGGTGIRVRLKIEWRNPCGFDSRSEHHRCYVFSGFGAAR